MKFRTGDIVSPVWETRVTHIGKIASLQPESETVYAVDWDKSIPETPSKFWHENNLTLVEREQENDMIIKLKPIQSEATIRGGYWTHVVLNDDGLVIAAFTSHEDAEEYKDSNSGYSADDWAIREVVR